MSLPFEYDQMMVGEFGGTTPTTTDFARARVVILPIPLDRTTSYVPGTRNGPHEILVASSHMELWDEETQTDVHSIGIYTLPEMEFPFASMDEVVGDSLSETVYITIDVDGFDPAIMPATGTPEPGGLSWYEALALLRRVIERRTVVGCDVVELSPIPGQVAPNFLCAKLVYKILSYRFGGEVRRWPDERRASFSASTRRP